MITFDEALGAVLELARPGRREWVPIDEAQDRVVAEAVTAKVDAPPCDVSAMDGYAVREADLSAFPVGLQVQGESFAGAAFDAETRPGTCVRIFTGAPVPAGADRVIVQEVVRRHGDLAIIDEHPGASLHIRPRGSDFARGDLLLPVGQRLHYRALTAAAAGDASQICVWGMPRIVLLSTGDELIPPGSASLRLGSIPDSLGIGIAALARDFGGDLVTHVRLRDDLPAMKRQAAAAMLMADLVVVTGGASVGEKDFAKQMFEDVGLDLIFSKVAIKPGKPVWLGRAGATLVIGLPGNPTSALVTARLLLAPLIAGMAGRSAPDAVRWRSVPLATSLSPAGARETFVRARWNGRAAEPLANQDSGAQRTLVEADLLLRRAASSPAAEAGDAVQAIDF